MHIHVIHDTDNCGIHGRALFTKRLAGGSALHHDQDFLVHTGAD